MKNITDSHVHLDLIARNHPAKIQWLKDNRCGVVSWAYLGRAGSVPELEAGLGAHAKCIRKYASGGLRCGYLTGIHPRSIPPDLQSEQIRSILEACLKDPLCRGIGEIGLETGDIREEQVFITQLELARTLMEPGQVIGIHTPRSDKLSLTIATLARLDGFQDMSASIVVDHCTMETIGLVLEAGFWAGVTLSPAKTSWDELKQIVDRHGDQANRIMCNTDSGSEFHDDVVRFQCNPDLPETIREKIFHLNAARFYSIPF